MSINKAIVVGRVGKDPEVKYFDNGNSIANLTVATNERGYKLANGTEVPERTEWHNVVVRRDQAQFVEKYVKKGSGVYIEGKIRTRDYEKNGEKRYITEIHADKIEFFNFGGRSSNDSNGNSQSNNYTQQPSSVPEQTNAFSGSKSDGGDTKDLPF